MQDQVRREPGSLIVHRNHICCGSGLSPGTDFSLLLFQPQAVLFSLQETREDEGRNVERLRVLKDVCDSFHAMENEQVVCAATSRRYACAATKCVNGGTCRSSGARTLSSSDSKSPKTRKVTPLRPVAQMYVICGQSSDLYAMPLQMPSSARLNVCRGSARPKAIACSSSAGASRILTGSSRRRAIAQRLSGASCPAR